MKKSLEIKEKELSAMEEKLNTRERVSLPLEFVISRSDTLCSTPLGPKM